MSNNLIKPFQAVDSTFWKGMDDRNKFENLSDKHRLVVAKGMWYAGLYEVPDQWGMYFIDDIDGLTDKGNPNYRIRKIWGEENLLETILPDVIKDFESLLERRLEVAAEAREQRILDNIKKSV